MKMAGLPEFMWLNSIDLSQSLEGCAGRKGGLGSGMAVQTLGGFHNSGSTAAGSQGWYEFASQTTLIHTLFSVCIPDRSALIG
jgi:hypothetical protein